MKKLVLTVACLSAIAFADIKLDFHVSVNKLGCNLVQWIENDYESGVKWKHYGKFACKDPIKVPVKLVGLKFLDVSKNLKGEYIFTYGEE
jgi:hypothetical protein